MTFVVQGIREEPTRETVKVTNGTPRSALATAADLLDRGIPVVTISVDGQTYTAAEFAVTFPLEDK